MHSIGDTITQDDRYAVASRDIVSESFDGDAVVLDLSCGKYFSFTDAGSVVWEAISNGVPAQALLRSDAARFGDGSLATFVGKLVAHGLVVPAAGGPAQEPSAALLLRLNQAKEPPDLTVFDDLADLLVADPIHDVEEPIGWPAVRQA
jgi:hypothetical protein